MSQTVGVGEAKRKLSELITRVQAGEEFTISRAGKPVARLVAIEPLEPLSRPRRPGGSKGQIWISPDFDDPLPPELQQHFE